MADLYDEDTVLWSEHQAALLRRRAAGELVNETDLDWPNIAEEIESLGRSLARELGSRIGTVMLHLLKLEASPADEPRVGWRETIREQRGEIERIFLDAPSLRGRVSAILPAEMRRARLRAREALADYGERPRIDLGTISYDADQVLADWFPDARMQEIQKATST